MSPQMQRPFPIVLTRDGPRGVLDLRLIFGDPLTESDTAGWQDVLKTFIDAAQCGALSGAGIAPSNSGCLIEHRWISGQQAGLRLGQTALDSNAYRVLLNLCHWGHHNVSALQQLELDWERLPELTDTDGTTYPAAWPRLSFQLQQYSLEGQTIAIDIELLQPQPADRREQINDYIGYWFKAANWSGYADEHYPPPQSTVIIAPDPMITTALDISWYIETYRCSAQMFDGLINCLEKISRTLAPIRQVTIGE
jgi:hypothetical protein